MRIAPNSRFAVPGTDLHYRIDIPLEHVQPLGRRQRQHPPDQRQIDAVRAVCRFIQRALFIWFQGSLHCEPRYQTRARDTLPDGWRLARTRCSQRQYRHLLRSGNRDDSRVILRWMDQRQRQSTSPRAPQWRKPGKLIREAIEFHFEGMRLHGEVVPAPPGSSSKLRFRRKKAAAGSPERPYCHPR